MRAHFAKTSDILNSHLEANQKGLISPETFSPKITAYFLGGNCEMIPSNRSNKMTWVAPMKDIGRGLWAWLSYMEEWEHVKVAENRNEFTFRTASVTVYFGFKNDGYKPQMFRSEWTGWAKWDGDKFSFSASGAGHPHWHFDALDSLHRWEIEKIEERSKKDNEEEGRIDSHHSDSTHHNDMVWKNIVQLGIPRIHFAETANWWTRSLGEGHAHSPQRMEDLHRWLDKLIPYLLSELDRI